MIPRYLIYWVNSIENPLCALADNEAAFSDGNVICTLAGHLIGKTVHFTSTKQDAEGKVRAVLTYFGDNYGFEEMPADLRGKDAARKIVDGSKRNESPELVSLLEYMFIMSARIVKEKESTNNLQITNVIKSDLTSLKQRVSTGSSRPSATSSSERDSAKSTGEATAAATVRRKDKMPMKSRMVPQPAKRQNVVRSAYPLRKIHPRGRDSYVRDGVQGDENKLIEEAARDELEGRLQPGVIMPVRQYIQSSQVESSWNRPSGTGVEPHEAGGDSVVKRGLGTPRIPNRADMVKMADWLASLGVYAPIPREYLSPEYVDPEHVTRAILTEGYQLADSSADPGAIYEQYMRQAAAQAHKQSKSFGGEAHQVDDHKLDSDGAEWRNGIALSELAAVVLASGQDRKHLVKQVESCDNFGRKLHPRFLIVGTETNVRNRIQALRNIKLACSAIRDGTVPASGYASGSLSGSQHSNTASGVARDALLTVLDNLHPEDVYHGHFPIWSLLHLIKDGVSSGAAAGPAITSANTARGVRARNTSRSRSGSPLDRRESRGRDPKRGRSRSRSLSTDRKSPLDTITSSRAAAAAAAAMPGNEQGLKSRSPGPGQSKAAATVWPPKQVGEMAQRYNSHRGVKFPGRVRSHSPQPRPGLTYYRRQPHKGGLSGPQNRVRFSADLESYEPPRRGRSASPGSVIGSGKWGQASALRRLKEAEDKAVREEDTRLSAGRYGNIVRAWDGTVSPTAIEFGSNSSNPYFHNRNRGRDRTDVTYNRREGDTGDSPSGLVGTAASGTPSQALGKRFQTTFPPATGLPPSLADYGRDGKRETRSEEEKERLRERKKEEATRERIEARRQGMMVRLQHRRNELAKKHHRDVLGVGTNDEASAFDGSGTSNCHQYEQDLQGVDAHVDITAPSGARVAPKRTQKTYPMASAMSKKQHDDHLRRIKRAARLAELGLSKLRLLQEQSLCWLPPLGDPAELAILRRTPVPQISGRQITSVTDWLSGLGLGLMDGEGGYFVWDAGKGMSVHSFSAPPPLPLHRDRVRNGHFLASVLYAVEPEAARHSHLAALLHGGKAITATQAEENIRRILWIFKLRRCPPLPEHLLVRPTEIVEGNKHVIWALMWEILQAYPFSSEWLQRQKEERRRLGNESKDGAGRTAFVGNVNLGVITAPALRYTSKEMRQLDSALVQWLVSTGVIRATESRQSATDDPSQLTLPVPQNRGQVQIPTTLAVMEASLRDGTLLCAVVERVLGCPLSPYNRHPHTYDQCIRNILKAVSALRNLAAVAAPSYPGASGLPNDNDNANASRAGRRMSGRFLYSGCEEHVARAHWDTVLGMLEDIRRCADGLVPLAISSLLLPAGFTSLGGPGTGLCADRSGGDQEKRDGGDGPYLGPTHFTNPSNFDSNYARIDYRGSRMHEGTYAHAMMRGDVSEVGGHSTDLYTTVELDRGPLLSQQGAALHTTAKGVDPHNDVMEAPVTSNAAAARMPATLSQGPAYWREGVDLTPGGGGNTPSTSKRKGPIRNLDTGLLASTDTVEAPVRRTLPSTEAAGPIGPSADLLPRGVSEAMLLGSEESEGLEECSPDEVDSLEQRNSSEVNDWKFRYTQRASAHEHSGVTLSHPHAKGYPRGKVRVQRLHARVMSPSRDGDRLKVRSESPESRGKVSARSSSPTRRSMSPTRSQYSTPRTSVKPSRSNPSLSSTSSSTLSSTLSSTKGMLRGDDATASPSDDSITAGHIFPPESAGTGTVPNGTNTPSTDSNSKPATPAHMLGSKSPFVPGYPYDEVEAAESAEDPAGGGVGERSPPGALTTSFSQVEDPGQPTPAFSDTSKAKAKSMGFASKPAAAAGGGAAKEEEHSSTASSTSTVEEASSTSAEVRKGPVSGRVDLADNTAATAQQFEYDNRDDAVASTIGASAASLDTPAYISPRGRELLCATTAGAPMSKEERLMPFDRAHDVEKEVQATIEERSATLKANRANEYAVMNGSTTTMREDPYAVIGAAGAGISFVHAGSVERDTFCASGQGDGSMSAGAAQHYDIAQSLETSPEGEDAIGLLEKHHAHSNTLKYMTHHTPFSPQRSLVSQKYGGGGGETGQRGTGASGGSHSVSTTGSGSGTSSSGNPTPSSNMNTKYMGLPSHGYSLHRRTIRRVERSIKRSAKGTSAATSTGDIEGNKRGRDVARAAHIDIVEAAATGSPFPIHHAFETALNMYDEPNESTSAPMTSARTRMQSTGSQSVTSSVDLSVSQGNQVYRGQSVDAIVAEVQEQQLREERLHEEKVRLQSLVAQKERNLKLRMAAAKEEEETSHKYSVSRSLSPARGPKDLLQGQRQRKASAALQWLQSLKLMGSGPKLAKSVGMTQACPSPEEVLLTLRDGVVLCRLVQKLERCAKLPGIVESPTLPAQKLQNIRRALNKLKTCSAKLPVSACMYENEIFDGRVDVIVTLLLRIKKAYQHNT